MLLSTRSLLHFLPRYWLLAVGLLTAVAATAQPAPVVFGLLDTRELTAAPFAHDSSAAVILCDYGTTRIAHGNGYRLQTTFERVLRVKVLRNSGTHWGTLEVTLWPGEQMYVFQGCTYNLEHGAVQRSPLDGAGKPAEESGGHRLYKLILPNVHEGSVVEFRFSVISYRRTSLKSWQFQRDVPVRWSEYRVAFPRELDFRALLHGALPVLPDSVALAAVPTGLLAPQWDHRWAMRQVPAFVPEPFMATPLDHLAWLEFSWAGTHIASRTSYTYENTWESIGQQLLDDDDFGRALGQPAFLKEEVAGLPGPAAAPLAARIAAVRALVMQHVKYNGDDGIWLSRPLRDTYRSVNRGNPADVNLLLVAALRTAHIDANPVLLSTLDNGRVNERFPSRGAFNYVLAHVQLTDGQDLLLDATDPSLPSGTVPERCLNGSGRLLPPDARAARWVPLLPQQRLTHFRQLQLSLSAGGELQGTMHEEYSGYAAARQRAELGKQGAASYCRQLTTAHPDWNPTNIAIAARTEPEKPLALDYQIAATTRPTAEGSYYLSPLAEFGLTHNPFTASRRRYPIDFGMPQDETLLVTLTLPPGYALASLPSPQIVDLPDNGGRFVCSASSTDGVVQLSSRLTLRKSTYQMADYEQLRELYRLLLAKQAEKLEIRKPG